MVADADADCAVVDSDSVEEPGLAAFCIATRTVNEIQSMILNAED